MQADEGHMKPADKKADGEQPKSLGVKSLLQRIFSVLRERSGCVFVVGVRFSRSPNASGIMLTEATPSGVGPRAGA